MRIPQPPNIAELAKQRGDASEHFHRLADNPQARSNDQILKALNDTNGYLASIEEGIKRLGDKVDQNQMKVMQELKTTLGPKLKQMEKKVDETGKLMKAMEELEEKVDHHQVKVKQELKNKPSPNQMGNAENEADNVKKAAKSYNKAARRRNLKGTNLRDKPKPLAPVHYWLTNKPNPEFPATVQEFRRLQGRAASRMLEAVGGETASDDLAIVLEKLRQKTGVLYGLNSYA